MIIIEKYVYTCHTDIVSSNHNKNGQSAPHNIHIYKLLYNMIKQTNIRYVYYTNTYVKQIWTPSIELCANGPS